MAYPSHITHHLEPVSVRIPEPFVVSYLANANGEPVAKATMANAIFVKTEVFDDSDAAWARWCDLTEVAEELQPAFISCQDSRGESIV